MNKLFTWEAVVAILFATMIIFVGIKDIIRDDSKLTDKEAYDIAEQAYRDK